MLSAMELFDLEDGEILVTEATSPNWTPAFAIIGACVCDGGGSLTHAATGQPRVRHPLRRRHVGGYTPRSRPGTASRSTAPRHG